MKPNNTHSNLFQFEQLNRFDNLFHFTTTINAGVSKGNYSSFNLGLYSGDYMEDVSKNREALASILGISDENIITPYQTHEDEILVVDKDFLLKSDLEKSNLLYGVDALITNQKGIYIGVGTADCVPVLLFDPINNILAAIHAGWRGTVAKLVSKTISRMQERFGCKSENMIAGIAPSISCEYFEVGDEVVEAFEMVGFRTDDIGYKNTETGKMHLDLWVANKLLLLDKGISTENIEIAGLCTYSNLDLFFSARREGIHSGRMLSGGILY